MKKLRYPRVLSEMETIELALAGRSIARFGDGELRLALGGQAISQKPDKKLAAELRDILRGPTKCLPCTVSPRKDSPKWWFTKKYTEQKYLALYGQKAYGSTFITRADAAPWINTQEYWSMVKNLWAGKNVIMVVGTDQTSLRGIHLKAAASVRTVVGPQTNAYQKIDQIEEEIGMPSGIVIMCLGATATALAERLARKGVHAVDFGHMGRYIPADWKGPKT